MNIKVMVIKKNISVNPSNVLRINKYYYNDSDVIQAFKDSIEDFYTKEYAGVFRNNDDKDTLFKKALDIMCDNIKKGRIYINDDGELIGSDRKPLEYSFFVNIIDAFLVKDFLDKEPNKECVLGKRMRCYYYKNYYGLFQVNPDDANEIFQKSATVFFINIRNGSINVNNEGGLIGTNNMPFKSTLTTYFMGIAKNINRELRRKRSGEIGQDPEKLANPSQSRESGMHVPYEKYDETQCCWFWYFKDKSTEIEVESGNHNGRLFKQMPYIGDNLHWWIGNGNEAKDIGALYNDMCYDDMQIKKMAKIARCLSQMTCMCKQILTYSLYLEKTNEEIAQIKDYKNSDVVKSKKHDCLKKLKSMIDN